MSAIEKERAILLRAAPFSETSSVLWWFGRKGGRLATIAKGAHRPRSPFLGQFDLFYTCEILFYARPREQLHILKECSPLDTRPGLRGNWRATAAASYFAALFQRVCPPEAPHPELFDLLDSVLDFLPRSPQPLAGPLIAELKLLQALGISPALDACLACKRPIRADEMPCVFSRERGGLLCGACAGAADGGAAVLARDVLGVLRFWQAAADARAAAACRCAPAQLAKIASILDLFIQYHVEVKTPARAVALSILGS